MVSGFVTPPLATLAPELGELSAFALAIGFSPLHIGLLLLVLLGPNPVRRGGLFVAGWLITSALTVTLRQVTSRFLDGLVMGLVPQAGNPGRVWALLLYWLHAEHELSLQPQALDLVQRELASLPGTLRAQVNSALDSEAQAVAQRHAA